MAEMLRRYGISRGVFKVLMIVSLIALIGGIILAIYGFARSGQVMAMAGEIPMELRWVSSTPGLIVAFLGLIGVGVSFVGMIASDATELAAEQLLMLRDAAVSSPAAPAHAPARHAPVATGDADDEGDGEEAESFARPAATGARPARKESQPRPERGEERLVETYQGVEIFERYNGIYIGERWFANLSAAKAYIDVSQGS